MQRSNLSSLALLLLSVALSLAIPTLKETSSLAPRARFCANSPHTVAGTKLNHRSPLTNVFQPRKSTEAVIWCAYGTQTYVLLTMAYGVRGNAVGNAVKSVLSSSFADVVRAVQHNGDGVIPGGMFYQLGANNVVLRTMNSNNHQLTYGVLGAAISALDIYMSQYYYGGASFTINDGMIEVGKGVIGFY